jgi:mono/diheme cytochrome c family protein
MFKRIALTALMLIMVPAFAFAGSYSISKALGSGTIAPVSPATWTLSGFATQSRAFTLTPGTNYVLQKVTNALGTDVTATYVVTVANVSTLTIPVQGQALTLYVYFAPSAVSNPPVLVPVEANVSVIQNTAQLISAGLSTVQNLGNNNLVATWTGPAALTFSASPLTLTGVNRTTYNLNTNVTASAAGTYTATLTLTAGSTTASTTFTITALGIGAGASNNCLQCHANQTVAINYATSVHAGSTHSTCAACHNPKGDVNHPYDVKYNTVNQTTFVTSLKNISTATSFVPVGGIFCTVCHSGAHPIPHPTALLSGTCSGCHTSATGIGGTGDAHQIQPLATCISCHAIPQPQVAAGLVNDNSGVRNIVSEFGKWSHHVTGRSVADADCAVCHLEGKASGTAIVVDSTYHMVDNKIHLRNCNTGLVGNQSQSTDATGTAWVSGAGLVQYAWNPATPDHTLMDQYCFSCHNAQGAPTAIAALAGVTGISPVATNPFNDTMSNQYDLLSRGAVVDAFSQFATGNSSHHAVRGAKYTATTLPASTFTNISTYNAAVINTQFAGNGPAGTAAAGNGYKGLRVTPNLKVATIKDAGFFATLYTPLGTATTLADNSTIHCGDCHTVGQFKANYASNADGTKVNPAIGAHGSDNEYLLRKADGSEAQTLNR